VTTVDLRFGKENSIILKPEPYLVKMPRVPCVGERILGPDDLGLFTITGVTYEYNRGFYFEPDVIVVYVRRGS